MSVMPESSVDNRIQTLESQMAIVKRQLHEVRCAYLKTKYDPHPTTPQPDTDDDEDQTCIVS